MSQMNPQIRSIEIGVKSLRQVTIYPLSMKDQFQTTDLITDLVSKSIGFLEKPKKTQMEDMETVNLIINAIETNLETILGFIDLDKEIDLADLTVLQFSELVNLIFEANYAGTVKNFQGLVKKVKAMLHQARPLQQSSERQATDLTTSSVEALGTEE